MRAIASLLVGNVDSFKRPILWICIFVYCVGGNVISQRFKMPVQIVHVVHVLQKRPQRFAKMFYVVDNVDNI